MLVKKYCSTFALLSQYDQRGQRLFEIELIINFMLLYCHFNLTKHKRLIDSK